MKIIISVCLVTALFWVSSCADPKIKAIQNAQNEITGVWEITEVSTNLSSEIDTKLFLKGQLNFNKCDAKKTDGVSRICTGNANIIGSVFTLNYYNNPDSNDLRLVLGIEPPYRRGELEVLKAFSGFYTVIINQSNLLLKLTKRSETLPVTDNIFIKATKLP